MAELSPEEEMEQEVMNRNIDQIEIMVADYFGKHHESPFKDFQMKEGDQMAVDLDQAFEAQLSEAFGDKTAEILGEYISNLVRNLVDNLSEEELDELRNQDKEDNQDNQDKEQK